MRIIQPDRQTFSIEIQDMDILSQVKLQVRSLMSITTVLGIGPEGPVH
jgi:hypothetical protein